MTEHDDFPDVAAMSDKELFEWGKVFTDAFPEHIHRIALRENDPMALVWCELTRRADALGISLGEFAHLAHLNKN